MEYKLLKMQPNLPKFVNKKKSKKKYTYKDTRRLHVACKTSYRKREKGRLMNNFEIVWVDYLIMSVALMKRVNAYESVSDRDHSSIPSYTYIIIIYGQTFSTQFSLFDVLFMNFVVFFFCMFTSLCHTWHSINQNFG